MTLLSKSLKPSSPLIWLKRFTTPLPLVLQQIIPEVKEKAKSNECSPYFSFSALRAYFLMS